MDLDGQKWTLDLSIFVHLSPSMVKLSDEPRHKPAF